MIPDVEREALRCFTRSELEGLQIHARYLRDIVGRNARTLALRHIHSVNTDGGSVSVRLPGNDPNPNRYRVMSASVQDLREFFHRVNNSFVLRLNLNFIPENRPFLFYVRARSTDLQCHVQHLSVQYIDASVDYAMAHFIGHCLRPRAYTLTSEGAPEDHVMLFAYDALRANVSQIEYNLHSASVPTYVITELLGDTAVEACTIFLTSDPRPWIAKFVEVFGIIGRGANTIRNVTLLFFREGKRTPLQDTPVLALRAAFGIEVPTPNSDFIKAWCRYAPEYQTVEESSVAKRFVFENIAAEKRLEVFVWTVKHTSDVVELHYAYHLQVVDL